MVICIADGSHFARERLMAFTLWHPDAVSGSHPPHLLLGVFLPRRLITVEAVDDPERPSSALPRRLLAQTVLKAQATRITVDEPPSGLDWSARLTRLRPSA